MANCKICNKQFHACSSCGYNYSWEHDYCCNDCFDKSTAITELTEVFRRFNRIELDILDNSGEEEIKYAIRKVLEEKK
jgi:hypothetical protein